MQAGKIIKQANISDKEFVLRHPQQSDVEQLKDYINELSDERTFIRYQGFHFSLEDEQEYLDDLLSKLEEDKKLSILAFRQDLVVGHIEITKKEHTEKHRGVLGMTVRKGFRNQGLGSFMLQLAIEQAREKLPELEIVELVVYANNDRAIHLYKKHGFTEFGRLPRGIKREEGYVDQVYMYRVL